MAPGSLAERVAAMGASSNMEAFHESENLRQNFPAFAGIRGIEAFVEE